MKRFLVGLATGTAAALVTRAIDAVEPWWLVVGAAVACLVWFGGRALEALADALD